jgi:hypothetical protein
MENGEWKIDDEQNKRLGEITMNQSRLRQKIESQLDQLSPDKLTLVSSFLDSIQTATPDSPTLRKLLPIKRGKQAKDLLKHTKTWQGDDLEDCLNFVRETRSESQF